MFKKKYKQTKEHKRKISEAHKGKKLTQEWKEKISKANFKRFADPKEREKLSVAHKGKKFTEETKRKMSEAMKGGNKTSFKKGHLPWNTGKKRGAMSEETKRKISKANKGKILSSRGQKRKPCPEEIKRKISIAQKGKPRPQISGKNHPNWLGGISFEPYSCGFNKRLKLKIKQRDNYTCQECGHKQKDLKYGLCIHHIDYNKKNNKENNLISLCFNCHAKTNFKRENWTNYFNNYMAKIIKKSKKVIAPKTKKPKK